MSRIPEEVKTKNRFYISTMGLGGPVHRYQFVFVMIPHEGQSHRPSSGFKTSDLGSIKGSLSRNDIYDDFT